MDSCESFVSILVRCLVPGNPTGVIDTTGHLVSTSVVDTIGVGCFSTRTHVYKIDVFESCNHVPVVVPRSVFRIPIY